MTNRTSLGNVAVGATLGPLELPPISRATLALFAGASGDHNPIHIDLDNARSAGFDDVFAHGMLSMAYLGRLLTAWAPQEQIRSLSARFLAITPVHGAPACTGTVTAIDGTEVTVGLAVVVADTTTMTGQAVIALD